MSTHDEVQDLLADAHRVLGFVCRRVEQLRDRGASEIEIAQAEAEAAAAEWMVARLRGFTDGQ